MSPFSQWLEADASEKNVLKLCNKQIGRNLLHTQHCPLKATSKPPSEPEKFPTAADSRASRNATEKTGPSVAKAHVDSLYASKWFGMPEQVNQKASHAQLPSQSPITAA